MKKLSIQDFTIIIDTREQLPFDFHYQGLNHGEILTERKALRTGDYSIKGLEDKITVERKSTIDLFGSVGKGRARFEREMQRMSEFDYSALVIESSLAGIFTNPPPRSNMNPKAVFRTLLSWSIKYNVHVWPAWSREAGERITYLLLKNFYDNYTESKNK